MYAERHFRLELRERAPWLSAAALAFLLLMSSPCAWGQAVTATLLGTVTDTSGAAVPNANLQIVEMARVTG